MLGHMLQQVVVLQLDGNNVLTELVCALTEGHTSIQVSQSVVNHGLALLLSLHNLVHHALEVLWQLDILNFYLADSNPVVLKLLVN